MDRKRTTGLIILLCSVLVFLLLTNMSLGNKRLDDLVINSEKCLEIQACRQDKVFEDLTLSLDGNACFMEEGSDSFYYSMVAGKATAMNPVVRLVGKESGLKLSLKDNHLSKESIQNNEALELIVYNDKYFHIYKLITTTLPIMSIECNREISEEDSKMQMTLYDNRANTATRVVTSEGFVRFRGATTLMYPKKGLKLTLTERSLGNNRRNNDISLLGMRQDDDWILYAAYNDQEKIRNVFSQNLWEYSCAGDNASNIDAGLEYKYLEVFINGEYSGLYALGSPLDEKQMELSGNVEKDALYKSIYWSNIEGIMMPANSVTGFEVKSMPAILQGGLAGSINEDGTISLKGSDKTYIDNSAWNLFLDYSIYLDENRNDSSKLMEAIDFDNAIDFYLFMTLIQGQDTTKGFTAKNYYFSVSKDGDRLSSLYAPWDMDISWGNFWEDDLSINYTIPYGVDAQDNFLFEQGYLNQIIANNDSDIWEEIFSKYEKLRGGSWSDENMKALLSQYEADIYASGAFRREMNRWPDGSYNKPEDGLSTFKEYVLRRLRETDLYIERLKKVKDKSILIKRSAQYKNFEDCNFYVAINDSSVLADEEYLDLFEYMGIDRSVLNQSTKLIFRNSKENKTDIITEQAREGFEYESVIGKVSFAREEGFGYFTEEDYGAYLDGKCLYTTLSAYEPAVRFLFIDGDEVQTMDLSKDYKLDLAVYTFNDLKLYLKALKNKDYRITLEYSNLDFSKDSELEKQLKALDDKLFMMESDEISGIKITLEDLVTGKLIDQVYYEYVMESVNGKSYCRITNCIR